MCVGVGVDRQCAHVESRGQFAGRLSFCYVGLGIKHRLSVLVAGAEHLIQCP